MTQLNQGALSRHVPARTETVRFSWVQKAFSVYTEQWRAIRAKCRKPLDSCWWCKQKFGDGAPIALAYRGDGKANVVLCESCADKAISSRRNDKLVESAFVWAIAGCGGGFTMSPFVAIFIWMLLGQPQVSGWLMVAGFVAWPIGPMWCFWHATRLIDRAYQ